jgi:hypothetical protein
VQANLSATNTAASNAAASESAAAASQSAANTSALAAAASASSITGAQAATAASALAAAGSATTAGNSATAAAAAQAAAQGYATTASAQAAAAALSASAMANISGKNSIINGMGLIAQRGASFTTTTAGNFYGGPDRFQIANGSSGANIQQSQGTMVIGGVTYPCITQTCTNTYTPNLTGVNYCGGIQQPIESFNCYKLQGQAATLSFWFQGITAGAYSCCLRAGNGSSYSAVYQFQYTTAGVPQFIVFNIPTVPQMGLIANSVQGMTINIAPCNQGTYVQPAGHNGQWQVGNYLGSGADIIWLGKAGNYVSATMIQLEPGPVATPYEWEDVGITFLKCLRYYVASLCLQGTLYIATAAGISANLPVPMRVVPTLGGFSNLNIFGGGAPTSPGVVNTNGTTAFTAAAQVDWASSSGSVGMTLFGICSCTAEF